MLTVSFHPTGKGYVVCERIRPEGVRASDIKYKLGDPEPLLLTDEQSAEFRLAMELEREAHE